MFSKKSTEQSIEKSTQTQAQVAKSGLTGQTDNTLLEDLRKLSKLRILTAVQNGEPPESIQAMAEDTADEMTKMDEDSLFMYQDQDPGQLGMQFAGTMLRMACLTGTDSCAEKVSNIVWTIGNMPNTGVAASMLQTGVLKPIVQTVMKLLGKPEYPEETAAERAAVIQAYLEQRRIRRG